MEQSKRDFMIFGEPYIVNLHIKQDDEVTISSVSFAVFASFKEEEDVYVAALNIQEEMLDCFKREDATDAFGFDSYKTIESDEEHIRVVTTFQYLFNQVKELIEEGKVPSTSVPEYINITPDGLILAVPKDIATVPVSTSLH